MHQPTCSPLQLFQPIARAAVSVALTVAGFVLLSLPSLWTGPM